MIESLPYRFGSVHLNRIAMPPFRNPFGKKPPVLNGANAVEDENSRPFAPNGIEKETSRPDYAASRASSSLSIKARKEEPSEYKLSGTLRRSCPPLILAAHNRIVVNDSGVYLPVEIPQWRFDG